jgi:hypothetical protein
MIDALCAKGREQFRREVKSRRGRRDGTALGRVNRLITLTVDGLRPVFSPHIRRQRRLPKNLQLLVEIAVMMKLQAKTAAPEVADHFRAHARAEPEEASDLWFFGGIDHGDPQAPIFVGKALDQQHFRLAAAVLAAAQARRKDFGVIEHE